MGGIPGSDSGHSGGVPELIRHELESGGPSGHTSTQGNVDVAGVRENIGAYRHLNTPLKIPLLSGELERIVDLSTLVATPA